MTTIPIDSRFVNAAVYIVVDVFVFAVLVVALISFQGWHTRRALLRGERVSLCVHFILLGILFALALGINGRTGKATRLITRQYISNLDPPTAVIVSDDRVFPQIMAGCSEFKNERLTYYPVAFDQERTPSIPVSTRHLRQSLNGNIGTAVNSGSVVCQRYEGAKPLLTVARCGTDPHSCCNLSLSPRVRLDLQRGQGGPEVWRKNEVLRSSDSVILRRNVEPVSYDMSSVAYDRLICLQFMSESDTQSSTKSRMNCMLGKWNDNGAKFTFRLGNATFPDSLQENVFDVGRATSMQFTAFSVETEIKWNGDAEVILSNGLHSIGGNMVPARLFLNTLVSRSSLALRVTDEAIYEEYNINVTDVSTPTVVGYSILVGLAVLILLSKLISRWWDSFDNEIRPCVPDITTYDGLLTLLKGDETRRCARRTERANVEFGIASVGTNGTIYSLGPVEEGMRVVKMPPEGLLRWHRSVEDFMAATKDDETLETASTNSVNVTVKNIEPERERH